MLIVDGEYMFHSLNQAHKALKPGGALHDGKPHTIGYVADEVSKKDKREVPVILDGVEYPSARAAAKAINANYGNLMYALRTGRQYMGHEVYRKRNKYRR